ncbi:SMR family transporter [Janibacter sp. RAF20_2_2]|uniref:Small multidrug resistance protein n=1 Tax=Janibacter hoylei PVAS-1 TaxID=1210046 RepID=A0A444BBG7_9MICO|nr:SMR family transporter [Janibacter hoylei]RWU85791.1 hypothetical protein CWN80_02175 [Janibacter hoylei PVAS-1]
MSWFVLIVSGMLEAVWAAALAASHGFTRPRPTLLLVGIVGAVIGLKLLPSPDDPDDTGAA